MKKLPKYKPMLTGHAKSYDVYQDKKGNVYHYSGKSTADFYNPASWKQVNRGKLKKLS